MNKLKEDVRYLINKAEKTPVAQFLLNNKEVTQQAWVDYMKENMDTLQIYTNGRFIAMDKVVPQ